MGGAPKGVGVDGKVQTRRRPPRRFRRQPVAVLADGRMVPVAASPAARLLGLALIEPGRAPAGLLIPRCRSVHTVGMRFPLDLHFLDAQGLEVSVRRAVRPGRWARQPGARSVLEIPSEARPL